MSKKTRFRGPLDWESLNQRWHTGWLEEQPEKPVKVFPDPDSYIGSRDLDAASAVWAALEEAGLDPKTHFREVPKRGLLAETPES